MSDNKKKSKVKTVLLSICAVLLSGIIIIGVTEFWYYPHFKNNKTTVNISENAADNRTISVMSANVRCLSPTDLGKKSWLYRADLVVKNVQAKQPDVIGFQEVTKFHYSYLCDALKGFDSVITYRDSTYLSEACPIFYRTDKFKLIDKGSFWLSETPDKMSKSWNSKCFRVCSYVILENKNNNEKFVVFNTHLDHVSDEARIGGIGVILDKIQKFGNLPSMIMGDFNAYEDSKTYEMATENFDDAKYLTDKPDVGPTYQNWGKSLDDESIDYFMLSKGNFDVNEFSRVTATYDGVYPSDHFPIFINVKIK